MAQKREIPADILQQALQATQVQEATSGFKLSNDDNFPVFGTYPEQRLVIYFPMTNTRQEDGHTVMDVVNSIRHEVKNGNYGKYYRCIKDLQLEALGWDGECPFCDGSSLAWDLYNHKLEKEAERLGLPSPKDDPTEMLKSFKEKIGKEREINSREAFLTTPIVHIVTDDKGNPTGEVKPYFLDLRLRRWNDKIVKALNQLRSAPTNPAGYFATFDFNYDTKGKQAEKRDAARNMTVTIIQSAEDLEVYRPLIDAAEDAAAPFTIEKANEVIIANEYYYKDEIIPIAEKAIRKTKNTLKAIEQQEALGAGGVQAVQLNAPAGAVQQGGNALMTYGQPATNVAPPEGAQPVAPPVQPGVPTPPPGVAPVAPPGVQPAGQPVADANLGQPVTPPFINQ